MLEHVDLQVGVVLVEVPLEIRVAQLVAVFELAEVLALLLNGVIGQVDELVVEILKIELLRTRPDVSVFVEVALQRSINARHECVDPEIKLSPVYQERIVDVFLHDEGFLIAHSVDASSCGHELPHFLHVVDHADAPAAIGVLSWFHDPSVERNRVLLAYFTHFIVLVVLREEAVGLRAVLVVGVIVAELVVIWSAVGVARLWSLTFGNQLFLLFGQVLTDELVGCLPVLLLRSRDPIVLTLQFPVLRVV